MNLFTTQFLSDTVKIPAPPIYLCADLFPKLSGQLFSCFEILTTHSSIVFLLLCRYVYIHTFFSSSLYSNSGKLPLIERKLV